MRTIIIIVTFMICNKISYSQIITNNNLIINGNFEQFTDTPTCGGGLNGLFHWFTPTLQPALYCHRLVNQKWPNIDCWARIYNGYNTRSGDGYLLLGLYFSPVLPYYWSNRAYIAQKLTYPLEKDSNYCFRFYAKFWNRGGYSRYTTNKLGVYFSIDSITDYSFPTGANNLQVNPQIETDSEFVFIDSVNWVGVNLEYNAKGGEQFITIGNFRDDSETPLIIVNQNASLTDQGILIFIDDIGLYKNECPAETDTTQPPKPKVFSTLQLPSAFTPNNDGKNDMFRVLGSPQVSNFKLCVYNRWGKQVYCGNTIYDGWDGNCNGSPCEMATYQWVATYTDVLSGEQRVERGNVTLIR